ncbi:MAG: DNA polymerase III subunit epsilon [Tahibacter sp.]
MRQIVLDTETTGLEASRGHRLIEIGCIELLARRPTGVRFHRYLNPERDIDEGAQAVHGISREFLEDKPRFVDVVEEFLAFVSGAELVIHNAAFDVGFLDAELARADARHGRISDHAGVLDTLSLAREKFPGQRNNLDALCKRLGVDNSHRDLHGALLDAQLLTDVYLALTAGQGALDLVADAPDGGSRGQPRVSLESVMRVVLRVRLASTEELDAHAKRLVALDKAARKPCVWRRFDPPA